MNHKKLKYRTGFSILLLIMLNMSLSASGQNEMENKEMDNKKDAVPGEMENREGFETAVFAGGCFWGVEAVFESLKGVEDVMSGYSGGDAETASYYTIGSGKTGHAEAVEIIYNPDILSFKTLLDVFFSVAHDPTQLNYQGPDVGSQYRSVVFYTSEDQKMITLKAIEELESTKVLNSKIVTEVIPLDTFYPAEDYHQDFMKLNPDHPYIQYWDKPKIEELEKKYPDLINKM
ncbi:MULTISPECIES: peptide-methionine (S)-S-oxide reductase MsrA [unclassified Oceanispirochaeta]|uniref:peptide-methionine (S)-S-oxide reductase MsrA n=1 Tax=unclassified Oceanispirochaeta TaxID=2635722 RepID=UPI000E0963E9|nr:MULTISPECIES: peptide-methionine (S)-S-oxide reductase MsrA [unclassified Oceanispirochaeta]MBF9017525.1 peptide-methionine (S)-S-oxide reductase MsrA [Oceanispirochaeta sp. M2]NPD74097.1 peptide-methionine (S)-S-oxide reductase MsrA [Oceanispirochaeta sp. M1]RDG30137.1 peptide-methionine (S)-S-oxide reductase [Oceanispirochaeta sp. M1]